MKRLLAGTPRAAQLVLLTSLVGLLMDNSASSQSPDEQQRDLVRVRVRQQTDPILRLNTGGHSASVRGLAFLPDSSRLCSAGLDKDVLVWNLKTVFRDLRRVYLRERTIRWQVARGLRGSIYAVDAAPSDGLLAIGGYGAMGTLGEIVLVNPLDGSLVKMLDLHRQTVCDLSFSRDGNWLASIDLDGRAVLWNRPKWQPTVLDEPDAVTYGDEQAKRIAAATQLRPIAIAGNERVILPRFTGVAANGALQWKLRATSIEEPRNPRDFGPVHHGMVTALAASADGSRLASADALGNLYLWNLGDVDPPQPLEINGVAVALDFSPDGRRLAVGTAVQPATGKSQLQIWNVESSKLTSRVERDDHVWGCRFSPDGTKLAYTGGKDYEVFVRRVEDQEASAALRGKGRRILKAAFAKDRSSYRIAFGWDLKNQAYNDYADLQEVFDPVDLQLEPQQDLDSQAWMSPDTYRGDWTASRQPNGKLQLYRDGNPTGFIELHPVLEGSPRCHAWLPGRGGAPAAIAVGTERRNGIYVFRLVESGECPMLRHFRGHSDYVASVGVSADGRYLVSGSADQTVRIWSLNEYAGGARPLSRWGAEFSIEGGALVAKKVLPDGPLFAKGLRQGHVLEEIRWPAASSDEETHIETEPAAILRQLEELPWLVQLSFQIRNAEGNRERFHCVPAWRPLVNLFAGADREWAFWAPEGYYDASVNGHTLFGWQVNRGLDTLPDFYRADQYQKTLERPEVMSRLLEAGSLHQALAAVDEQPPEKLHEVLPQKIAATPRVEILTPQPGSVVKGDSTRVTARITTPKQSSLLRARVFANGVVAKNQQVLQQRDLPDASEATYAWDVPLPSDERALIQLLVSTDAPTGAFSDIVVDREQPETEVQRKPKLYLLAAGINEYADSEVPRLSFSVADAQAIADRVEGASKGLYDWQETVFLSDEKVTPDRWRTALQRIAEQLEESARPDDLLVLFMAGHGVVDPASDEYYFLGHETRVADVDDGSYKGCIAWQDFRLLADVPCRKLVVLDTCHSGALQPLRARGLKAAVRALQEDIVLAVTASAGHEKAAENKRWGHGVFTKCLLEALAGQADESKDGTVTLDEMVAYVTQSVQEATDGRQHPTAGPKEILPFVTLPLARTSPASNADR